MKNLFTILLIIPVFVFGQSKFTEATFADFNKKFKANPIETLKNNASEKLIYVLGNGRSNGYQELLAFYGAFSEKERTFPELTVYQVGNTAVATGVVDHSYFPKNNPSNISHWVGKFTYTFGLEKGKWLLVSAQHTDFQEPFTKETLNEILEEYKTDSKAFFNKYLSPDFRYTNQKGSYQYQKEFLGGTAQSIVATEILQPVIFQSGDLATVSGLHKTIRSTKDGSQQTSHDAATYTFQRRAGKWMFVGSQQNPLAPATFDQATFKAIMAEWEKDPKNFFANEIDPKALFTNGNGELMTQAQLAAAFGNGMSLNQKKVEDLKVYQSGNTGVATGKTFESYNNGENLYTGKFTYTFSQQNGKWVIASAQHTDFRSPKEEDEAAIKSTIEGETNAFKMNDANKTTSFWLNTPYTSHSYTAKGLGYVRGAKVGTTITDYLKANPKIDNSPTNYHDYIIRINGNSAWATYISDGTSNGKKVVYNKAAYLEKTNGEWKICSMHSTEAK